MLRVGLLPTCVVDSVAPQVGVAVVRVLRKMGHEVTIPKTATCCGQPAWNSGFAEESASVAKTTLEALENHKSDVIVVPAGSCATMIKVFWQELFEVVGDHDASHRAQRLAPRVREFSEFVASRGVMPGKYPHRVAYHHSCHMLRELGIKEQPEKILGGLDGCTRAEWLADERCCGFGGMFSIKQPEMSVAMADDKIESLKETQSEALIGCDQSCLMHLEGRLRRRGESIQVKHLAEVLEEAL
ncbi:MAG TPA: (Fe-S)-binding protein [Actinomycetota bacterium]|nr:(Fe-S)-binding protein [Actinomycetota bacterium]